MSTVPGWSGRLPRLLPLSRTARMSLAGIPVGQDRGRPGAFEQGAVSVLVDGGAVAEFASYPGSGEHAHADRQP